MSGGRSSVLGHPRGIGGYPRGIACLPVGTVHLSMCPTFPYLPVSKRLSDDPTQIVRGRG